MSQPLGPSEVRTPARLPPSGQASGPLPDTGPGAGASPSVPDGTTATSPGQSAPASCPTPPCPTIGAYRVLGELGRGGMGIVYRARHSSLDRLVALKTMRTDLVAEADQAQRFEREMRAVARLDHPNIVRIYEVGRHEGRPYFTMPYLPGGTLAGQRQRLLGEPRAALAVMEKIAHAVQYAHEHGVLHRDLKPGNVLLDERGEPCVSDFGLAKICDDAELTQTGVVLGTPAYMAPEQAAGRSKQVGPQTDVWSLGVMLYELLIGRRPFLGDSGDEVKWKIATEEPPAPRALRPDLDAALEMILLRCLEKDPQRRYPTAAALADDLGRHLRGEPVSVRSGIPPRRRRRYVVLGLSVAAAVALAAVLLIWGPVRTRTPSPDRPGTPAAERFDPPLVLIGEDGPPKEYRWLLGKAEATLTPGGDGKPFSLRSAKHCLLELRAEVPWEHYRLEAQVRHDDNDGEVGVFVAHGRYVSARGAFHTFWNAHFAEFGRRGGGTELAISCVPEEAGQRGFDLTVVGPHRNFLRAENQGSPGPWRTLAVELNGDGLRAYLDGKCTGEVSAQDLPEMSERAPPGVGDVKGKFNSRGALGLFIDQGSASFKQVVIKPLPERHGSR